VISTLADQKKKEVFYTKMKRSHRPAGDKMRKVHVEFGADYLAALTADLVAVASGKWQVASGKWKLGLLRPEKAPSQDKTLILLYAL